MTPAQARDQIFDLLRVAWAAGASGIVGGAYTPVLYYQGQEVPNPPVEGRAFGRVDVHYSGGRQSSL
ncbi:hypothetical protein ACQUFC_20780, partial [Enterococcus casseliflavus]